MCGSGHPGANLNFDAIVLNDRNDHLNAEYNLLYATLVRWDIEQHCCNDTHADKGILNQTKFKIELKTWCFM